MDRYPHEWPDAAPADDSGGIELLEDRTRPIAATRGASRFGVSLPGAVAGAFLITAIAFGAAMRPADPTGSSGTNDGPVAAADADGAGTTGNVGALGHGDGKTDPDADKNPGGDAEPAVDEPKTEPKTEPKSEPAVDEPKTEPAKAPEPTKAPTPAPLPLSLGLKVDGARIVVDWSACEVDGFYAYKVVRSTDGKISWPAGDNDTVVTVIENASATAFTDTTVVKGKTYFYKVLAFAARDGVGFAACRTDIRSIAIAVPDTVAGTFGLTVSIVEGKVLVDWSACSAAGFDYYKVVRSKDATVTFPAGDYDVLIAAVGPDGETAAWDKDVPGGKTLYYRVFCVDKSEAGYAVLAATATKSVTTPVPAPKPTPVVYTMGFNVQVTAEGVVLGWEACGSDGFSYYKVTRSRIDNPSYFPWTDGTEVIAVIENSGTTTFVDAPPEGGTWYYRIQSIGHWDGQKVLLGQTPAQSVAL
jgi:hypothetical protein